MRQTLSKGMVVAAAATGVLSMYSVPVSAHSAVQADGEGSSGGLLSGNVVQVPVNVPLNLCGNNITVIGSGNVSSGNTCVNTGGASAVAGPASGAESGGSGQGGASAQAPAPSSSGGLLSGNVVQVPVNAPVNVCGNNITVIGSDNGALDNFCANDTGTPGTAQPPAEPDDTPRDAPGAGSGNHVDAPVEVPINGCGLTVGAIATDSPASGECINEQAPPVVEPPVVEPPVLEPPVVEPPVVEPPVLEPPVVEPPVLEPPVVEPPVVEPPVVEPPVVQPPATEPPAPTPPVGDECPGDGTPTNPGTPPTTSEPGSGEEPSVPSCPTTEPPVTTPPATPSEPTPPRHQPPASPSVPNRSLPPVPAGELARTGSDQVLAASAAGAGFLLGGAILYRRGRRATAGR